MNSIRQPWKATVKLAAALISVIFLAISCTSRNTPAGTVEGFLAAARKGDRPAVLGFIQEKDRAFLEKIERMAGKAAGKGTFVPPEGAEFRIGQVTISGESATVVVTTIQDGKEKTDEMKLIREGGKWRIDLVPDEMLQMLDGLDNIRNDVPK